MKYRLAERVLLAAAVLLAGFTLQPVFADEGFAVAIWASVVVPIGMLSAVSWRWPGRTGLRLAASACGFTIVTGLTVLPDTLLFALPTPATIAAIADGWINGLARLLSTGIPVTSDESALVVAPSLVWLTAHTATELSLRTRASVAPTAPPIALTTAGLVLAGGSGTEAIHAVALAAALLGVGLVRFTVPPEAEQRSPTQLVEAGSRIVIDLDDEEGDDDPTTRGKRLLAGSLVMGLCCLSALLITPTLPWVDFADPYDPREPVDVPREDRAELNPLVLASTLATEEEPRELFRGVVSGMPQNWRLLVLNQFDGEFWTTEDVEYETAGGAIPVADDAPVNADVLEQQVEIVDLDGLWLPAASRPTKLSAVQDLAVQVDPATGVLINGADALTGGAYSVTSAVSSPADEDLRGAIATEDRAQLEYAQLPEPAGDDAKASVEALRDEAVSATAGAQTAFEAVALLQEYFISSFEYDAEVPPGHSYGHLGHFVFRSQQGSAEQFAAAFVVMARALGYPSRVVVGFLPGELDRDGAFTVRSTDAHAWPEVYFERLGWVPFEPNPARSASNAAEIAGTVAAEREGDTTTVTTLVPPSNASSGGQTDGTERGGGRSPLVAVLVVLALLVVAGGGLVGVRLARGWLRRRSRRRSSDARQQVIGAYNETVDHLSRAGVPRTRTATATELAELTAERWGQEVAGNLRPLGDLSNHALFSSEPVSEHHADGAWTSHDRIRRSLREARTRRERINDLVRRPS